MLEELPRNLGSRVGYRIACGEAARLAEMATFGDDWGRDFAAGVGGEPKRSRRKSCGGAARGSIPS